MPWKETSPMHERRRFIADYLADRFPVSERCARYGISRKTGYKWLEWGLEQVKAGRIKPLLDRALPLSEAANAHRLIANNEVAGNIVLLPWAG